MENTCSGIHSCIYGHDKNNMHGAAMYWLPMQGFPCKLANADTFIRLGRSRLYNNIAT